ncbi:hypothetical protein ACJRO7_024475 [Eucalyptus globulus]|uniref:EGF-like domain-containing protein n=1 Tax=Eucalyptus globulus TaxID=34317 RepID=A0ABD3K7N2_EUCGL
MGLQDANGLLLIFILFFTCLCTPASSRLMSSRHDEETVCGKLDCGMETCRETPGAVPRYACDCYSGWTKPQMLGFIVGPSCVIPNCTMNYRCGGEPPMPHPCLLVFCEDGDCVANGESHRCQCHQGSVNLMGNLGPDCDIGFGSRATSPSPLSLLRSSALLGNSESSPPSS